MKDISGFAGVVRPRLQLRLSTSAHDEANPEIFLACSRGVLRSRVPAGALAPAYLQPSYLSREATGYSISSSAERTGSHFNPVL